MKIIEPEIWIEPYDGTKIMKNIERACRTCYRSEDHITEDSYKKLLKNCINRGHESVLEHEKITIRFLCSINSYKDLTRHRAGASFSIESTRYCNYSKDKFDNNIKFMDPVYIQNPDDYQCWKDCMAAIEKYYMQMSNNGAIPDHCRTMLPHSTVAEVVMTCNIREWKHVLSLRCNNRVHPEIRQILIPVLLEFKKTMPEIFESVEYDEAFPKDWYAKLHIGYKEN